MSAMVPKTTSWRLLCIVMLAVIPSLVVIVADAWIERGRATQHAIDDARTLARISAATNSRDVNSTALEEADALADVTEEFNGRLIRNLTVLAILAGVSLGLAWRLGETVISKRVAAVVRAAQALARGDLAARTGEAGGTDELGELCRRFDEMAVAVEQHVRDARVSAAALRDLTHRLQSVREEEQSRMAREIHDQLGQLVTAVRMDIVNIQRKLVHSNPEAAARLAEMTTLLDTAAGVVRRIAGELRPALLEDLGLAAALEWMARDFTERWSVPVGVEVHANLPELDLPVATGLFRVAQEALTNVARHARASAVTIEVRRTGAGIRLDVSDDGVGFDPAGHGPTLGVLGMRERAALLGGGMHLTSEPGHGTCVSITVPLNAAA
jgi:signal transduction histidine kinase